MFTFANSEVNLSPDEVSELQECYCNHNFHLLILYVLSPMILPLTEELDNTYLLLPNSHYKDC